GRPQRRSANFSAKKLRGSARRQPSPNTSCMLARPRHSSAGPKPSRPTPMPKCRPRRPSADRPKRNAWTPMPPSATVWRAPSAMSTNAGSVTPMTSTPMSRTTGPRTAASIRRPVEDPPQILTHRSTEKPVRRATAARRSSRDPSARPERSAVARPCASARSAAPVASAGGFGGLPRRWQGNFADSQTVSAHGETCNRTALIVVRLRRIRRPRRMDMFERFTDRARRVVVLAQEEAKLLKHNYIGTEHILLGLIHEGEGLAAKALRSDSQTVSAHGETCNRTALIVVRLRRIRRPRRMDMFERFTDRARRVVVLAQEEAKLLKHNYIGTEHILLGLIHEGEGLAAKAL